MIGARSPEQRREICLERFVASVDIRSSAAAPPSIGKIGPVVDEQCFPSIALICETIERHLTQGRLVVGVSGTGHDDGVEDVAEAVPRRDALDEQVRIHRHEWLRSVTLPRNAPGEGMERAVMVSSARLPGDARHASPTPSRGVLGTLALAGCGAAGVSVWLAFNSDHVDEPAVQAALMVWTALGYVLGRAPFRPGSICVVSRACHADRAIRAELQVFPKGEIGRSARPLTALGGRRDGPGRRRSG